jgi:hypothetical protein
MKKYLQDNRTAAMAKKLSPAIAIVHHQRTVVWQKRRLCDHAAAKKT